MTQKPNIETIVIERFRPGCYAIVRFHNRVILVEKMRGPFTELYELPGGGIDHGENHLVAMIRELHEEIGLEVEPKDLNLSGVFTHVVEYPHQDGITSLHMIGVVYEVLLDKDTFSDIANGKTVGTEV